MSMQIDMGIDEASRKEIANGLAKLLADTYTLYIKTHGFHWNITGPHFISLHTQFEGYYTELQMAVDEIAERIRTLGEIAPGSYAQFAKLTTLEEETGVPSDSEMVKQLVRGNEKVAATARNLISTADKANDQGTLDILTKRIEVHEKAAWMLRSFLG